MEHKKPTGKEILKETYAAVASNPGNVIINPIRWIRMNPIPILKQVIGLALGYLLMVKVHWLFFPVFLVFLIWNVVHWYNIYTSFKVGDVNPGKVIHLNPDRIAVATNMSKGIGDFPVIKIVELKLLKEDRELNKIIPTVAGYNNNPHGYPFWSEFHPVPINHGVTNKEKVAAYMNRFTDADISRIDECLQQINNISIPGTYKVDVEISNWKDYEKVSIGSLSKMRGPKDLEKIENERANLKIAINQVWEYHTREIEKGSTIQIVKIDETESGHIVHISIRNVQFKNSKNNTDTIHHVPIEMEAFKNSITKLTGFKRIKPDYEDGYKSWKEAYDNGQGGVFTISISQIVDSIDQTVQT